jgi:hypothetical protein
MLEQFLDKYIHKDARLEQKCEIQGVMFNLAQEQLYFNISLFI